LNLDIVIYLELSALNLEFNSMVSVIIPIYNHKHTIVKALESIIGQSFRPLEVIIVNDGSTDGFEEIVPKLVQIGHTNGVEVKVLNQANKGAPKARNEGFLVSQGEYLIFWDADTIGDSQMLSKMVKILDQKPEISFVYSGFKFGWKKFKNRAFDPGKLKEFNFIDITSLIRRKDFVLFDESLKKFQDWDFWLGLSLSGKKGEWINEILYKKIVRGRKGISSWLPSFFYKLPFKTKEVKKYEEAKKIIYKKHHL